jgi:hypothetical protein
MDLCCLFNLHNFILSWFINIQRLAWVLLNPTWLYVSSAIWGIPSSQFTWQCCDVLGIVSPGANLFLFLLLWSSPQAWNLAQSFVVLLGITFEWAKGDALFLFIKNLSFWNNFRITWRFQKSFSPLTSLTHSLPLILAFRLININHTNIILVSPSYEKASQLSIRKHM